MKQLLDDRTLFNTIMREAETLAQAFVNRMIDTEAQSAEGFAIMGAFLAQVATVMCEGDQDNAEDLVATIAKFGHSLVDMMCDEWHKQHAKGEM